MLQQEPLAGLILLPLSKGAAPTLDVFLTIVFSFYKTDETSLVLIGAKKVIHLLKNFKYIYLCDGIMVFSREPDDQLLGVVSSFAV